MSVVRIGFDMDGVLADFARAFRSAGAEALRTGFIGGGGGGAGGRSPPGGGRRGTAAPGSSPVESRRRRDAVWKEIYDTTDFWTTLEPHDPGAVRRIHDLMIRRGLEVVFITQRPSTIGQTVQRQTQLWLRQQGFDLPSVLVISGSRGAAAGALRLDYHVDDSPQNCLDIVSDSRRPILIVPEPDPVTEATAKRLRIGVARSIAQALDILEHTGHRPRSCGPGTAGQAVPDRRPQIARPAVSGSAPPRPPTWPRGPGERRWGVSDLVAR